MEFLLKHEVLVLFVGFSSHKGSEESLRKCLKIEKQKQKSSGTFIKNKTHLRNTRGVQYVMKTHS